MHISPSCIESDSPKRHLLFPKCQNSKDKVYSELIIEKENIGSVNCNSALSQLLKKCDENDIAFEKLIERRRECRK